MTEKISFLSGDQQIQGTLVTPELMDGKKPGVLFFHGMTSSEERYIPIAEKLAENGIVGMTLSIRGHGDSQGNFDDLRVTDGVKDGLNAYDFFARYDFIDKNRVGLCGASVGAAISAMVAGQRAVRSMVLRVPAVYTEEMMRMTYREIMLEEEKIFSKISNIRETPAMRAIAEFTGSVLIITSGKDAVIPMVIPREYFLEARKAKRKQQIKIPGATHNLTEGTWRQQFIDETVRWFVETL